LDKTLSKKIYHGFFYSRGVTTYWREIFDRNLLSSPYIIELDLSANFNNIDKKVLLNKLKLFGIPE
jgi:hypothetical protein